MKGLLLKDWYLVTSQMKTMYLTVAVVLLIWVFSASDSYLFPVSYAAIFLGILPVSLLSYDQNSGWVEYGQTLPFSKKTLVTEKYLVGLLCVAAAVVVGGAFIGVLSLRSGAALDESAFQLANSISTILVMNGVCLPLVYRFGAEKTRMIYILAFAGFGVLLGGGSVLMEAVQNEDAADWLLHMPVWLAAALLLTGVLVYAVSWRVSVAWYGKYKK